MIKSIAATAIALIFSICSFAQPKINAPVSPLSIPLFLTGNFGELRANHFHSGLDFKTQNKIGFPVYAFDEGYVARLMIAARGNGRALYINHPNGTTTVYLHLDKFSPAMEAMLEDFQYAEEAWENLAQLKYKQKTYRTAANYFTRILKFRPSDAEVFYSRGECKFFLEDYQGVIKDCDKAVENDNDNGKAFALRAQAKIKLNDKEGACKDFYKAKKSGYKAIAPIMDQFCK